MSVESLERVGRASKLEHRLVLAFRRASAAGTGPYSAVMVKIRSVFVSRVSTLARAGVGTVCSTAKLVGEFSLMTVSVPSPCELNASMVAGLKVAPSQPLPMGRSVMMCPSVAERMTMFCLSRQAAKRMLFFGVQRQAGAAAALARDVVFADHLHGVRVDDGDGGFVFNVDIDFAAAVGCRLLRRAADVDGAEDCAVLIVKHGDVRRDVAEHVEVVIVGVVEIAVGIALRRRSS